ncbi:MAG: LapA family protein [Beijerinckiaceae bacterium]|nr:LapA family protein [Beijerinckiaceae bacterium]MCI0736295.1 LapA family protein [Beijerinckiaceae bacterium]
MKRFLKLLFLVPLALAVLVIAETNRHPVPIYLDPLASSAAEGMQITVPLFIVMLVAIMIGVIFGSVVTYFEQGRHRRAARQAKADADMLRAELGRLSRTRPGERAKVS